ncbi:MAG: hypothetical protein ACYTKD_17050 [Planctomycetota bacterium]|jgi:hypothetical protein
MKHVVWFVAVLVVMGILRSAGVLPEPSAEHLPMVIGVSLGAVVVLVPLVVRFALRQPSRPVLAEVDPERDAIPGPARVHFRGATAALAAEGFAPLVYVGGPGPMPHTSLYVGFFENRRE